MTINRKTLSRRTFMQLSAAGVSAAVFAACPASSPGGSNDGGASTTMEKVSIVYQDRGGEAFPKAWESTSGLFAEQNADIEVQFNPQPDGWIEKLLAQFVAGTAPDLFNGWGDNLPLFAQKKQTLDLRAFVEADLGDEIINDWVPNQLMSFVWPDIWYAIPQYCGNLVLYYNKDIFDEAGEAYPPASWDDAWDHVEYVDVMSRLTKHDGDRVEHWGGWVGYWYSGKTEIRLADFGGGAVDPADWTRCALGDQPNQDALEWIRAQMYDTQVIARPDMVESFGSVAMFAPAKVASAEEGSWVLQRLVQSEPQFTWDVAPLPKGPGGHTTINTTDGWAIWQGSANPDAAWDLMQFLISEDYAIAMARAQGLQPARRSLIPKWIDVMRETFPELEEVNLNVWQEAMDKDLGIIWPYFPNHGAAKELITPAYDSVFVSQENGVEAIAAAADEVTAVMAEEFPDLVGTAPPYASVNW
ncbi:substrate-binding domain-containing protein [Chloroflexi bacterium TSY]|nr:substrate-binding domain-containing protein [Chloroflexi bacterium TSY]